MNIRSSMGASADVPEGTVVRLRPRTNATNEADADAFFDTLAADVAAIVAVDDTRDERVYGGLLWLLFSGMGLAAFVVLALLYYY